MTGMDTAFISRARHHLNIEYRAKLRKAVEALPGEFAAQSGGSAADLLAALEATLDEADRVLAGLGERDLLEFRDIQGRHMTVLEAVFHVVEHFSFHMGQIVYVAKLRAPGSIQFYDDTGGLARPKW